MTDPRRYRAYLLRMWQTEDAEGHLIWRAALEEASGSERHGFADLEHLYAFLQMQTSLWAAAAAADHVADEESTAR